jgi:putative transposase
VLENLALRQQLATFGRATARPMLRPNERTFWVALSRVWSGWRSCLLVVKPATVIAWHRRGYERYWRWRSGKPGRPRIDAEHIAFIRRISSEHPEWGEDRIAEELRLKLGVQHSPSTVRRTMVRRPEPRDGQTWRTFIRNHATQVFACDFLVQYTALFSAVYVFVVMEIASRRIVLINVTANPSLAWVEQQFRQASEWSEAPRFVLHDNDGIFGQYRERQRRGLKGLSYRCRLDVWLADAMGIEGVPIPYGAPNANPHVERFHRTLRQEALDHFILVSEWHVLRVCREFVRYYNGARPSQAIHAIPAPYPKLQKPPAKTGKLIALPVLGGIAHDYRRAA